MVTSIILVIFNMNLTTLTCATFVSIRNICIHIIFLLYDFLEEDVCYTVAVGGTV